MQFAKYTVALDSTIYIYSVGRARRGIREIGLPEGRAKARSLAIELNRYIAIRGIGVVVAVAAAAAVLR